MKKIALLSTIGLCALLVQAAPLTPEAALERALGDGPMRARGVTRAEFTLADTRAFEGTDAIYLFSRGDYGFAVVSADDAVPALLGYGETPLTVADAGMAPGFSYWLDFMARRVAYIAENGEGRPVLAPRPEREPIAPLCTTQWNQSAPYNLKCPTVGSELSVTGCVATAMSQAMKYHSWPDTGVGQRSYEWNGQTLSIDFSACNFRWDLMADCYQFNGTVTESDNAVAELMKAAGYSVSMNYSPRASGAMSINIAPALGEYFKYDRSLQYLMRDYYGLMEWENIIYKSLSEDGPVIYDGQSNDGGHSFICDGYDSDGYFHFNWGWGGMSDGWFRLDALDPLHQGIGGASSGFNFMQDAIVGIRPDRTGTSTWHSVFICDGGLEVGYDEAEGTLSVGNLIYNSGPGPVEAGGASIGLRLQPVGADGAAVGEPVYLAYEIEEDLPPRYGYRGMAFAVSEIADGTYKVDCVYRYDDGNWDRVRSPISDTNSYMLDKQGADITLEAVLAPMPELQDGVFQEKLYLNDNIKISGRLVNPGDQPFDGNVMALLLTRDLNKVMGEGDPVPVSLEAGESIDFTYDEMWERPQNYRRGKHYIALAVISNNQYVLLNEPVEITCYDRVNGIDGVSGGDDADMTDMRRGYYTVAGVKVAEAEAGQERPELPVGVYVVRAGERAMKIVVK